MLVIITSSALAGELPADSAEASGKNKCFGVSISAEFGSASIYGNVHDVFTEVAGGSIGIGVTCRRVSMDLFWQSFDIYEYNTNFVSQTGYLEASLILRMRTYIIQAGVVVFRSRYIMFEPQLGFRWSQVLEDYPMSYDPHPNWDLNADSRWDPMIGFRFSFTFAARSQYESVHWGFIQWRMARLDFDNEEYGDGYSMEAQFGYCFDWMIF